MITLKQVLIVTVGLVLAGAMVLLGIWQLDVYRSQGNRTAEQRAASAPLELSAVDPAGPGLRDAFGRTVRFSGQYDPALQVLVAVDPGTDASGGTAGYRVLTGMRRTDGSIVAVVRGVVGGPDAPPPPRGARTEQGILLPSEDDASAPATDGTALSAVRLPVLAQRWSGSLVGGFVTLSPADSRSQGLTPTPLDLPQGQGRLRNAAYAFQWWLFAAFAVFMAVRMARDVAVRGDPELDDEDDPVSVEAT